jgi:hypothetical protein
MVKGMYHTELKILYFNTKLFFIFIILINLIFYKVAYPIIINFLIQYETFNSFLPLNINMQLKLNEYLTIFLKLIYSYNIILTLP